MHQLYFMGLIYIYDHATYKVNVYDSNMFLLHRFNVEKYDVPLKEKLEIINGTPTFQYKMSYLSKWEVESLNFSFSAKFELKTNHLTHKFNKATLHLKNYQDINLGFFKEPEKIVCLQNKNFILVAGKRMKKDATSIQIFQIEKSVVIRRSDLENSLFPDKNSLKFPAETPLNFFSLFGAPRKAPSYQIFYEDEKQIIAREAVKIETSATHSNVLLHQKDLFFRKDKSEPFSEWRPFDILDPLFADTSLYGVFVSHYDGKPIIFIWKKTENWFRRHNLYFATCITDLSGFFGEKPDPKTCLVRPIICSSYQDKNHTVTLCELILKNRKVILVTGYCGPTFSALGEKEARRVRPSPGKAPAKMKLMSFRYLKHMLYRTKRLLPVETKANFKLGSTYFYIPDLPFREQIDLYSDTYRYYDSPTTQYTADYELWEPLGVSRA